MPAAHIAHGGYWCDSQVWTTAQFISWLESQGAFNHPYWMCKGSWAYANNKVITDTGCGNICLAGAVVEVIGTSRRNDHTRLHAEHVQRWRNY
ncbi:part of phage tail fiber [Escherichia coli DEC12A]|nr:part of phage tail fiber [Escherichia coli DEC12A]